MMKAIPRSSVAPVVAGVLVVVATFGGCEEPPENMMADKMAVAEELAPPSEFPKYGDVPTLREILEEYAQGVPNYGYDPAGPHNPWAFYPLSFDVEQDPDYLEDQALFDSLSAGLRTQFQGAAAEVFGAWKEEQERAEAQLERDEAEYAVFIEEHLRRRYGGSKE
jgi:hypothetical protein